jgi:hypothetical protein
VRLVQKLTPDLHDLLRRGLLTAEAAAPLTSLEDDDTKRNYARLFVEGKITSGADMRAAIRAARNGTVPGGGFTVQEGGVKISVGLPGQDPAAAIPILRQLLKDLGAHGGNLNDFQDYLAKRVLAQKKAAIAAQKQAEAEAARAALAGPGGARGQSAN